MTNVKMPELPPGDYWQVSVWNVDPYERYQYAIGNLDLEPHKRMVVRLMRQPARKWWGWLPDAQPAEVEVGEWGDNEEGNARQAVRLAMAILKRPEVSPTHQLNGLYGYQWGGTR